MIVLLQLQNSRQLTLAKKDAWLAKFATENGLVYWLLDHSAYIIWIRAEKQPSCENFNFFTGDCGVGEVSWF